MASIPEIEIINLIRHGQRWIDVRAPIEFKSGSIPGAINLPILNDDERRLVGTCYKHEGREKAIALGHQIVSGVNRDQKIQAWVEAIQQDPTLSLFCYRGGLRSQISQSWIKEAGFTIPRVHGGYKVMRNQLIQYLKERVDTVRLQIISGPTGSLKTQLIQWLGKNGHAALDLEKCANHRGSAFGAQGMQPSQINFEHLLASDLLGSEGYLEKNNTLFVEDESRLIGKCIVPDFLFVKMRSAPILWIDEPIENRIETIFKDYIANTDIVQSSDPEKIKGVYGQYFQGLEDIKKRLGLEKYGEIYKNIQFSCSQSLTHGTHDSNRVWIQQLLKFYYDPLYLGSLSRRAPELLIKASAEDIKSFVAK